MNVPDRRSPLAKIDRRAAPSVTMPDAAGCLTTGSTTAPCRRIALARACRPQGRPVPAREQHIHRHRPEPAYVQPLEQPGMYRSRPRPAADGRCWCRRSRPPPHRRRCCANSSTWRRRNHDLVDAPQPSESRCRTSQQAARQTRRATAQRPADQWRPAGHNASNGTRPSHHGKGVAMTKRWGEVGVRCSHPHRLPYAQVIGIGRRQRDRRMGPATAAATTTSLKALSRAS